MSIATPNRPRPALPSLVIAAVFTLAAAIIALGVVGLASAQAPPAAPTNVTVLASGAGFVIGWDASATATSHWVAWMSDDDYEKYRADDWTKALQYEQVAAGGDTHVIPYDSSGGDYWIIVGSVSGASAVAWGEWHQATALQVAPEPEPTDDDLTQAYVETAIAYYDANGLDATIAHYNAPGSIEGERALYLIDAETTVFLASPIPAIRGLALTDIGPGVLLLDEVNRATEQGHFFDKLWLNVATGQQEPARFFIARQDGLVFMSLHLIVKENVADATKEYVNRATQYYDDYGLDAMVAHYNTRASFDGQFYLFMMDENDVYLVHPFIPRLIGTDIKDLPNKDLDGNPLGVEIAQATTAGIWVEYLWPNPLTFKDESKVTWAIRHDGKIFASGYYTGQEEPGLPAWATTDPREYTEQYVNQAIARYQEYGLESVEAYYNSVASFEGEFYLFATDPNDTYIIHPVFPERLIGTDIKAVTSSDNPQLGKELASATNEEGVWVEYLWPHPMTLADAPKVAYAKRYDGYLFASGYYPLPDDPRAYTREYIQEAVDLYESDGLDALVSHYSSRASIDGQWRLSVIDGDGKIIVSPLLPNLVGTNAADLIAVDGAAVGLEMLRATAAGHWFSFPQHNFRGAGEMWLNSLAIRHADGLIFVSGYHTPIPDEPTDDELTQAYVETAIAYYDANGRDATITRYNNPGSIEGERALYLIDAETTVFLASPIPAIRGLALTDIGPGVLLLNDINRATEQGHFFDKLWLNVATGQQEPARFFIARQDGLVFMSAHYVVKENVADATQEYVNRAIRYYDDYGLDAMVAHYNTRASFDGQFYLFMMDENDVYLVHPFIPRLVGTDIKDLPNQDLDGNPLGVEIAQATAAGIWVEYLWPNPLTFKDEKKVTWAIRHDGKIFASGYYTGQEEPGLPAWATTDPREYTEQYVNQAIARYKEYGLESVEAYYNSVASFEGEFYLFATDPNDTYIIHPVFPERLIGTDIKAVTSSDNPQLGKELASATNEEGVWVEYQWPHPMTLADAPKVAYAKRYDGYLFASGYYPLPDDPRAYTREYIQQAIDLYESDGRDAMVAHYSSRASIDGQWRLSVIDGDGKIIVSPLLPNLVGTNAADLIAVDGAAVGLEMLRATAAGHWFSFPQHNFRGAGEMWLNSLAIRHADGLIFVSGYHTPIPDVEPEP